MNNALLDKDFLIKLDQWRHKTTYVRLISLNVDEDPIAEITGNVLSGSINVDGSSSVRRTCNIQLVTEATRLSEIDWTLRTKFKVLIGLENKIDSRYDDIIWFPQGTFVITSFNSTLNAQGYQINIQGKDKMCLLNGDVGGQLFAAHEFSTIYTTHKDGTISKDKIPIKTIIREAIHTYAQEPYSNIFINDLETCGVELIDYVCDDAIMYVFEQRRGETEPWTHQICFSGSYMADEFESAYLNNNEQSWDLYLDVEESNGVYLHYHLLKRIDPTEDIDTTAGYRATDLTYNGDLIVNIGGNITSMLDEIVKMLGEFEYFYDVNGRFIFQRKKIYFNSSWTNAITTEDQTYYDSVANSSAIAYDFLSGYLIDSFQNKPNLNAIRNDYSVWGKRKNASGSELAIHMRYALDARPTTYWSLLEKRMYVSNAYNFDMVIGYEQDAEGNMKLNAQGDPIVQTQRVSGNYDWRELIYQMARDNLRAENMVQALTKALAQKLYHGSYYKMQRYVYDARPMMGEPAEVDYRIFYRYNDLTKKFEPLKKQELDGTEDENTPIESIYGNPYYGQIEFEYCKENNIPLFTPLIELAEWTLTTDDIDHVNQDMWRGIQYNEHDEPYESDAAYTDYSYGQNSFATLYFNILYSDATDEEKEQQLGALTELQQREQNVIQHYTNNNVLEDMRREIDEWSDTYKTGYDAYYADMLQFWPVMYRTSNVVEFMYDEKGNIQLDEEGNPVYSKNSLSQKEWKKWNENGHWNPELMTYDSETRTVQFKNPELLPFWLDFIEQDQEPALWQYSVAQIGRRSKSINDDQVKAIYFRDTPPLLFVSEDYEEVEGEENLNYVRINLVPPISNYFRISAQGKSAKSVMDSLLYEGTYYQDSVTISSIPIYYLEPNVRIQVQDDTTGINGQYLIKSYSLQLAHNGTMSITATRVTEAIL